MSQPSFPVPRLASSIHAAAQHGGIALLPFIAGGFPDLPTTTALLKALNLPGIGAIEVGFPFSDPVADGPVIQEAFTHALLKGFKTADLFEAVAAMKSQIAKPLTAMVSYSIVYRCGVKKFLSDAKTAGFTGILIPDLPPPEAEAVCDQVLSAGLETVLLVAPTTTPARRELITSLCTGFVYYLSIAGITGERDALPADLAANVRQLRTMTDVPVCVGFGIGKPQHINQLRGVAEGAIVGSAIVRETSKHAGAGPEEAAGAVREYCRHLLGDV